MTVIKRTIGGDGVFTIGGSFGSHQVTTANGIGSFTVPNVEPGPYQLTETPPTGWAASPWGGNCSATGALTITAGTTNVTCDITNTRQSTVTIDKVTVPSTDQTSFPFTASPGLAPAAFNLADSTAPQSFANIAPNTAYTFAEAVPAGYALVTSGAGCTPTASGVTVTPIPGQTVACTFTNTKLGSITIDKTAAGGDATFEITEPTLGGQNVTTTRGTGTVTYANVLPGTYDFGETPLPGWIAGDFGGSCAANGTITIVAGQAATCSITNTRQATISVTKATAPESSQAFSFAASGGATPASFSLTNGQSQAFDVTPDQAYTFSETNIPKRMAAHNRR